MPFEGRDVEYEVDPIGLELIAAAAYIRQHGWAQEAFIRNDGSACAFGAIDAVAIRYPHQASMRLRQFIGNPSIGVWNDTPGRTKEEVIAALEAAARMPAA